MPNSYVLFVLAGLALVTAMWMAVKRPPPSARTEKKLPLTWHAVRVTLVAGTASLAAVCVLLALGQLQPAG